MIKSNKIVPIGLGLFGFFTASTAFAGFDQWKIDEVFTAADGKVQFIELHSSVEDQQHLAGQTLVASNHDSSSQHTFTFGQHLSGSTLNSTVLVATSDFAQLTGLTPDYIIERDFIFTQGGSLSFASGLSSLNYAREQLPRGGLQSLNRDGAAETASPTNYSGLTATVSVDPVAVFDDQRSVMNLPVLVVPGMGIGHLDFSVNVAATTFTLMEDYYLYSAGVEAGSNPATLTGNVLYVPAFKYGNEVFEFSMTQLSPDAYVFGNPEIHNVTNLQPEPEVPQVDPSVARGEQVYLSQCSSCHGASGEGTSQARDLRNSSFNTFEALRNYISAAMPMPPSGMASDCQDSVSSSCATDAANYILTVIQ